jgi:hypothetical protein
MTTNAGDIVLIAAIVSGVFAFLGAIFGNIAGQLLNRKTQRETWLLQKRAEVFSKFILDLEEYNNELIRIDDGIQDNMINSKAKSSALGKLCTSEIIVCFYLSDKTKDIFKSNIRKYISFTPNFSDCSNAESLRKAYEPLFGVEKEIYKIFENNLSNVSWYK